MKEFYCPKCHRKTECTDDAVIVICKCEMVMMFKLKEEKDGAADI